MTGPSAQARIEIYEELAPTVAAGIGIREGLRFCADRHRGAKRATVDLLADGIDRDVPLSETMRAHPEIFTVIECAVVATGERTGRLDVAFRGAASQLERSLAVRNQFIHALAYPALLVHCFILMCSLVGSFRGGSFLKIAGPAFGTLWGGAFLAVSAHAALRDDPRYARFLARVPLVGRAVKSGAIARFARAFSALHGGGVSYDETLRTAADASGNALLRADAERARAIIAGGATLPVALSTMTSIPADDLGLLVAGEQSGDLERAAGRVADLEQERFEVVTKRVLSVLPSILVVMMGVAVAIYAVRFYAGYFGGL